MKFIPDHDYILVSDTVKLNPETISEGGIILTREIPKAPKNWFLAEVEAVGPGYYVGTEFVRIKKSVGDKVIVPLLARNYLLKEEEIDENTKKVFYLIKQHEAVCYAFEEEKEKI